MKTHLGSTAFMPVIGKITAAVLIFATLPTGSAGAGEGTPDCPSASAWVKQDKEGHRDVYYMENGKPVFAGRLTGPPPPRPESAPLRRSAPSRPESLRCCVWTPMGCIC
jgi:hypothetical protein